MQTSRLAAAVLWIAPAPLAAQLPHVEYVATIGCSACNGPGAFGEIQALALGPDGIIAVGDRDPPRLRVFEVEGRLRWTAGRDGDGPGELRLPVALGVRPDGAILVVDSRQLRISTYDARGRFAVSTRLPTFPVAFEFPLGAGRALMTATDFRRGAVMAVAANGTLDTVLSPLPFPEVRVNWFSAPVLRSDGGFAFGEGRESYRINVYGPDGSLERAIVRDVPRTRRTPTELDNLARRATALRTAEGGSGRRPPVDPFRSHFTALDALAFDDQDRLWVRTERGGPEQSVFDLFDRTGTWLGEVRLDARVDPYRLRGDTLAGVVAAEDGTDRIVVWRVRG